MTLNGRLQSLRTNTFLRSVGALAGGTAVAYKDRVRDLARPLVNDTGSMATCALLLKKADGG